MGWCGWRAGGVRAGLCGGGVVTRSGSARLPGGGGRSPAWGGVDQLACLGGRHDRTPPVRATLRGKWLAAPSVATLGMSADPVLTVGGGGFL